MATNTKIQWTDATFNVWRGCTKISPGCQSCYAEKWGIRQPTVFGQWGDNGHRVIASETSWHEPFLWDKKARLAGERRRVFCASLGDVFEDRPELVEPRVRLWSTIRQTPMLDWQLLTKRPENIPEMVGFDWGDGYPNVWLGVSVEDQKRADERIAVLRQIPAVVRFLSVEPMLEAINLGDLNGINWCICGGESGPRSRPFDLAWARSIRHQCQDAGVPFFLKQLGSNPCDVGDHFADELRDRKGGDISEWPHDLRIREFPQLMKTGACNEI